MGTIFAKLLLLINFSKNRGGFMVRNILFVSLMVLFIAFNVFAQEPTEPTVDEMVICTSVEARQPAGADTAFVKTVGQLYCYTKISSDEPVTVSHVWHFNGEQKAEINLSVKGKMWRTWSSKNISEDWVGDWKVDVVTSTGKVLKSQSFVIK